MSVIFQKGRNLRDIQLLYLFVSQTFWWPFHEMKFTQVTGIQEKKNNNNPQPSEKQVKSLWEQRAELHQSLNVCHPGSHVSPFPISDTSFSASVQIVTRAVYLESSEEKTIIAFQISWQTFSKIICSFICASPSDILTALAWQFVLWQPNEDHSEDCAQARGSLGKAVSCAVTALPWSPQVACATGLVWSLWRGGQLCHHCWSK